MELTVVRPSQSQSKDYTRKCTACAHSEYSANSRCSYFLLHPRMEPRKIQFPLLSKEPRTGTSDKRTSQQATAEGMCLPALFRKLQPGVEEQFLLTFCFPRACKSQGGQAVPCVDSLMQKRFPGYNGHRPAAPSHSPAEGLSY